MKRNYLCLLLVMLLVIFTMLFSPLPGVCAEENIIVEWDKIFGGSESDSASSLIQTNDGGYAVAGYTSSKGAGDYDFWVIKLDSGGNKEWDKTFGGTSKDYPHSLIQTNDGGYAVAGYTESYGAGGYDFWLIKLDSKGNKLWDKAFGGSDKDVAESLIQTTDGGYALAGYTFSKGAGYEDFWLMKLNGNGNMEWDKTFGGSHWDRAHSLIQTGDGGYAIAGYTFSKGSGKEDFWIIKLNSQGNIDWDRTYGGVSYDEASSLIQTDDGGYAVAGKTYSKGAGAADFWLIKLDIKGNVEWDETFGGSNYDEASSLIQTDDDGYAIAGGTSSKGESGYDFWVIKLDSDGNKEWDKTFGGSNYDYASSLIQISDGSYVVAGWTRSKGAGGGDFWVIKFSEKKANIIIPLLLALILPALAIIYYLFLFPRKKRKARNVEEKETIEDLPPIKKEDVPEGITETSPEQDEPLPDDPVTREYKEIQEKMEEQAHIRTSLSQTKEKVKQAIRQAESDQDTARLASLQAASSDLDALSQQFEYGKLSRNATQKELLNMIERLKNNN
jgi:uncharacterized delta-60 repeat protein